MKEHWTKGRFPVRAMNSDELREAIEQPARKQSLYFEPPNLVGKLIDEVGQMPGALPLLSFTLSELYIKLTKRWIDHPNSTARALGIEDYNHLGGVAGALTRRATEEYDNLVKEFGEESGKAHQATMRRVMLRMVTIEGGRLARRRVPESELVYFDAEENKRVAQVSDRLVKARLLVKGQETGEPYIEPAHDFLVRGWDKLQTWIKEKQEDLLLQQPLTLAANEWQIKRRLEDYLWNTNPRLALLKKVLNCDDNWLNQIEAQFVRRSVSKKRSNTIVRWSIAGSVLLGSVIFSTVIWQQLQITQLREKAARSRNLLATDPVAGLVIAINAIGQNRNTPIVNMNVVPEVQSSLLSAVQSARESYRFIQPVQQGSSVSAVAVSAHKKIVSADESGNVYQWDSKGKPIKLQLGTNNQSWGVTLLSFSPDGNILSVSREKKNFSTELKDREVGREVKIWDFKQNKLIQLVSREEKNTSRQLKGREVKIWDFKQKRLIQPSVPYSSEVIAATFSPSADLKMIVSGGKDGRIRLWDLQGNEISQSPEKTDSPILAVAFSLDRKLIVSADGNSDVRLWKLESRKILGSPTLIGKCDNPHSVAIRWNSQQIICNQKPDYSASGFRYQSFVKVFNHLSPTKNSLSEWEELSLNSMNSGFLTKVLFASFSPNGETIVTGDQDGSIHFWSLVNRVIEEDVNNQGKRTERANIPPFKEVGQPLLGHSSNVESVAFSSDGKKIISGSWDGTIRLWDVEQNLFEEKNFSNQGTNLTLSPDGQTVAIGGKQTDNKATITLLNIIKGKQSGANLRRQPEAGRG